MALETGTVVNDLTITNPTSTDPKSQGDDHFRLVKTVLKNSFAGFTGAILLLGTEAQGATVNDFIATISPAPAAYVKGMTVHVTLTHTNTSAATLAVNALGAKTLYGIDNTALSAGDLVSGQTLVAYYDGTNFILTSGNDKASRDGATYTGTHNFTGATVTLPTKVDVTSGTAANITLTGVPVAPTAAAGTNSTQIATTAFAVNLAFASALPAQTGNAGKYITTDGTSASWAAVPAGSTIYTALNFGAF